MPELPEVETIVRHLRPQIRGKRILDVWSNTPQLGRGPSAGQVLRLFSGVKFMKSDFINFTRGREIADVRRAGKNIILMLSGGRELWVHLMMTGKLLWNPANIREKYIRFWMRLSGGNFLALHDIRKFGRIRLIPRGKLMKSDFINLGPDALFLSFAKFREIVKKRKGAIKPLLLNQSVISGVGNIYSDEILWYAGVRPTRKADTLSEKELRALYAAMKKVLRLAIKKEGTSSRDYRKPDGSEGGYYRIRKAYQRAGEKCLRDGAVIKRVVIGQRSAHYCPKHQK